jgi:hypothetical protein
MTVLTLEPEELLGLNALVELSRVKGPDASATADADAPGKARDLLRTAIADELEAAGLPWAPSAEAVRVQAALTTRPPGGIGRLLASEKVRRYGLSALAVIVLVVLWGGYGSHWQWTGFPANAQLWDWLHLLLLPVVLGTIPLWIEHSEYVSATRRTVYVIAIAAWTGFVLAGYLVPLNWTGFSGNTLWDWVELILLPLALATFRFWPSLGRPLTQYHKGGAAAMSAAWIITLIGGYGLQWAWTGYRGNTLWDWLQLLLAPIILPTVVLPAMIRWASGDVAGHAQAARAEARARLKSPDGSPRELGGSAARLDLPDRLTLL